MPWSQQPTSGPHLGGPSRPPANRPCRPTPGVHLGRCSHAVATAREETRTWQTRPRGRHGMALTANFPPHLGRPSRPAANRPCRPTPGVHLGRCSHPAAAPAGTRPGQGERHAAVRRRADREGGRTWALAGLLVHRGGAGRETGLAVTASMIRIGPRTSLVLCGSPRRQSDQATSQASGMLSVSRVRPIQTASRASAGPLTRTSSASVAASATLM